jgi:hypothetical protein
MAGHMPIIPSYGGKAQIEGSQASLALGINKTLSQKISVEKGLAKWLKL